MRLKRHLFSAAAALTFLLATSPAHATGFQPVVEFPLHNIAVEEGGDLFLEGYDKVLVLVADGFLSGNFLSFQSGGSIDFLNPVQIIGIEVEFCTFPECGPFPGDMPQLNVWLPSKVGNIEIHAGNQIQFKGVPTVPEPATGLLLGGAMVGIALRRRALR